MICYVLLNAFALFFMIVYIIYNYLNIMTDTQPKKEITKLKLISQEGETLEVLASIGGKGSGNTVCPHQKHARRCQQ